MATPQPDVLAKAVAAAGGGAVNGERDADRYPGCSRAMSATSPSSTACS